MDLRQRLDRLASRSPGPAKNDSPTPGGAAGPGTPPAARHDAEPAPAPAPATAERLRRLLEASPRAARRVEPSPRLSDHELAERLGGSVPAAGVVLVEGHLALHHVHGRVALERLCHAPLAVLAEAQPDPTGLLFLDTETTGLAGGTGTLPFLLGLARLEADGLRLRQYFLTGFAGEAAMLAHARPWLAAGRHLVSFNGKSFDLPLLLTRHRLRRLAWPLDGRPHLDLLHPTRAAFGARWPDCRLQRAEVELLGLKRPDDLPGWQVPEVWGEFVRTGRLGDVPRILEHNRLDVITLAALLAELARVHAEPGYGQADVHALARSRLRAGRPEEALAHLHAGRAELGPAGLLDLARLYRRRGDWEAALAIWRPLAAAGEVEALLALAKYHEHVARDFNSALAACRVLMARQPGDAAHAARCRRLRALPAARWRDDDAEQGSEPAREVAGGSEA